MPEQTVARGRKNSADAGRELVGKQPRDDTRGLVTPPPAPLLMQRRRAFIYLAGAASRADETHLREGRRLEGTAFGIKESAQGPEVRRALTVLPRENKSLITRPEAVSGELRCNFIMLCASKRHALISYRA